MVKNSYIEYIYAKSARKWPEVVKLVILLLVTITIVKLKKGQYKIYGRINFFSHIKSQSSGDWLHSYQHQENSWKSQKTSRKLFPWPSVQERMFVSGKRWPCKIHLCWIDKKTEDLNMEVNKTPPMKGVSEPADRWMTLSYVVVIGACE